MLNNEVPRDFPGNEFMGDNVRPLLKRCASSAKIFPLAKLCKPDQIEIGEMARIHDFVFMWGGLGIRIGNYNDIQPFVNIWGGGEAVLGDYISVGGGSQLLTATYDYNGYRMVDGLPSDHTNTLFGKLVIESDVYIGVNCTLMPNITIGEGAVVGGGSFVNKDVEPWSINVGSPAKKIGTRPRLKDHIRNWKPPSE
jgi:acetyltransferase-like isoleucine patch superfamily enzyme